MAGIILAGGMSRRMGTDKALLPWHSGTLLDNAVELMEHYDDQPIVVVDKPRKHPLNEAIIIKDRYPQAGPLGGIVTGLQHPCAQSGFNLVVACDMPLVQAELIRHLSMWAEINSTADAIIPVVGGREQVLLAVYHARALKPLKRSLESGERAVHNAIQNLNCVRIPESLLRAVDPGLLSFRNVNTREDYEELRRQYGQA